MCEACNPPKQGHYEGTKLVLEPVKCDCNDCRPLFEANGPRCPKCHHAMAIEILDRWEEPDVWINPRTKRPVRLDEAKPN